jgi:outer membrane protein assembly factor BamB
MATGELRTVLLSKFRIMPAVLVVAVLAATPAVGGDWPQWRGPNRDGVVRGVKAPAKWPRALKEEWKVTVGEGVSCPVVVGNHVYVFARQKDDEVVYCLDVASGKEVWKSQAYPAPYKWWPGEGNFSKGPRSTPTVAGGRVYTAGVSGVLSCLDARSGKVVWRKQSKEAPPYGGPASPLVADGLCVVHLGCDGRNDGLTALDAVTGEVRWRAPDGSRPGSGSPILADLAGQRQVVMFTSWNLRGFSPATGKTLWAVQLEGWEKNSTPVLYGDLILFADYKAPLRAVRLEKGDKGIMVKDVWRAAIAGPYMSTPVLDGDLLFGMSVRGRGCFCCLDARTGKTLWQSDEKQGVGYASVVNAGGAWLFLTERGRLVVVKPGGARYEPIAEYAVSDRQTWAHPVFLGDRILIRDDLTLRSFRVEPER